MASGAVLTGTVLTGTVLDEPELDEPELEGGDDSTPAWGALVTDGRSPSVSSAESPHDEASRISARVIERIYRPALDFPALRVTR